MEDVKKSLRAQKVVMAERFHFHRRQQAVGENVADYVAALGKLAIVKKA